MHTIFKMIALASIIPASLHAFEKHLSPQSLFSPKCPVAVREKGFSLQTCTSTVKVHQRNNALDFFLTQGNKTLSIAPADLPPLLRKMTKPNQFHQFLRAGNSLKWHEGKLQTCLSLKGGSLVDTPLVNVTITSGDLVRIFVPLVIAWSIHTWIIHPHILSPLKKKIDTLSSPIPAKKTFKIALYGSSLLTYTWMCALFILHFPGFSQVCEASLVPLTFEKLLKETPFDKELTQLNSFMTSLNAAQAEEQQLGVGVTRVLGALQNTMASAHYELQNQLLKVSADTIKLGTQLNFLSNNFASLKDNITTELYYLRKFFEALYFGALHSNTGKDFAFWPEKSIIAQYQNVLPVKPQRPQFLSNARLFIQERLDTLAQEKALYIQQNIHLTRLVIHLPELLKLASTDTSLYQALKNAGQILLSSMLGALIPNIRRERSLTPLEKRALKVAKEMIEQWSQSRESFESLVYRMADSTGLTFESVNKVIDTLKKRCPNLNIPQNSSSLSFSGQLSFQKHVDLGPKNPVFPESKAHSNFNKPLIVEQLPQQDKSPDQLSERSSFEQIVQKEHPGNFSMSKILQEESLDPPSK